MIPYIVYNELFEEGRWYYGTYYHEKANAVADQLNENGGNYCVCRYDEVESLHIMNMPRI